MHEREPIKFVVTLAFDTIERKGIASPFYARLVSPPSAKVVLQKNRLMGRGLADWPLGTLSFPSRQPHLVIPAGFQSTWETVQP